MDHTTVDKLDALRGFIMLPFILNSAYRCERHNERVGGGEFSAHKEGRAVDIRANGGLKYRILAADLEKRGFTGIGVYRNMLHLDTAPATRDRLRPWAWAG
jgi:uncharacterized protein YcbK (DUF882 family)